MKGIADMFLDAVHECTVFDEEARERITQSVNEYDRPSMDSMSVLTVIVVTKWGSITSSSYYRFINDPWSALSYFTGINNQGNVFFIVKPGIELTTVDTVSGDMAGIMLHDEAKKAGFQPIPDFNNADGFMVSFDELRGSIPEHMREAFEYRVYDEHTGNTIQPHVLKLQDWYNRERDTILGYLRLRSKRVQLKDADNEDHKEWVDVPVTKLGFGFGRFDRVSDQARQSTAFFNVNDNSPEFKPDVSWNWHLQDTSRWLYAGAIAINYDPDMKDPQSRISISAHH